MRNLRQKLKKEPLGEAAQQLRGFWPVPAGLQAAPREACREAEARVGQRRLTTACGQAHTESSPRSTGEAGERVPSDTNGVSKQTPTPNPKEGGVSDRTCSSAHYGFAFCQSDPSLRPGPGSRPRGTPGAPSSLAKKEETEPPVPVAPGHVRATEET